jgi:Homeodomain-like domain
MEESVQPLSRGELPRREVMRPPDEVAAMLRLKALGWGIERIAKELGCSHMTVRHYVAQGGWVRYRGGGRPRKLAGLEDWVALSPACRGCRCRAPGAFCREGHRAQPADDRAQGGAAATAAGGGGAGDPPR